MLQNIIDDVIGNARVRVAQKASTAERELENIGNEIVARYRGKVGLALASALAVGVVIGAVLF